MQQAKTSVFCILISAMLSRRR